MEQMMSLYKDVNWVQHNSALEMLVLLLFTNTRHFPHIYL